MAKNFIKVSDQETKQLLLSLGYKLINESGGMATFLNDATKPQTFSSNKIVFSDKLNV